LRLALLSLSICVLKAVDIAASESVTLRYTISSNGQVAGHEVDTYLPDGRIQSTFEFNDRGRGPKISANYVLDSNGLPLHVDETGNDYLKAPVDEHFEVKDGTAQWKSTAEKGEAPAGSFYISNNGAAAETAFLVAALAKANGPVHLFPAGEARLERMTDLTIEDHWQKICTSPPMQSQASPSNHKRSGSTTICTCSQSRETGSLFCGKAGRRQTTSCMRSM
jgi:hypothetical protein